MLDLDPPVQLQAVVIAAGEHELGRAGACVADRLCEPDSGVAHLLAKPGVERRGRRLLEHLLVAPLDRALALPQRDDTLPVAEELDLDVTRPFNVALAEHAAVAERSLGLPLRGLERLLELEPLA